MNEFKNSSFFLSRLFKGEYSLPKAYWLFCVIPSVVLGNVLGRIILLIGGLDLFISFFLVLVGYFLIAFIGTWRSANKYAGWKVWSFLAKVACILGFLSNLFYSLYFISLVNNEWASLNPLYESVESDKYSEHVENNVVSNDRSRISKTIKSFDECLIVYADNTSVEALEKSEIICNELFPIVDMEKNFEADMFDFNWYTDFWNVFIVIKNVRTHFPINGCTATIRGSNSEGGPIFAPIDVFFSFSDKNNTSSIMTIEDTSLFHYIEIKKIHYKGRSKTQ